MQVLVVGGAGYIGSHMVKLLCQRGFEVTVLDNLSAGYRDAVTGGRFVLGDLGELDVLDDLLRTSRFDGVLHFASHIQVGESVREPAKYYRNNVFKTQRCWMRWWRIGCVASFFHPPRRFSASRCGPIDEDHPKNPINPYGRGKWMVEQMLQDYEVAYGLKAVCLRYFNAAGADPGRRTGRAPRAGDAPDSAGVAGRRRPPAAHHRVRNRLRYAGRRLHPRLHPRQRSVRGASAGAATPVGRRR
jgi:UDP-glucose 4-epimerase